MGDLAQHAPAERPGCLAGSYDHFLNFQIGFIIILQLAMCVFCAAASYIWRQRAGYPRFQLAMDKYVQARICWGGRLRRVFLSWRPL
jgi:hypothetical protein